MTPVDIKNSLLSLLTCLLLFSCGENPGSEEKLITNIDELQAAIGQSEAGDEIVLKNGVWADVNIDFFGVGTEKAPITLRAETPGEVFLEGQSYLHLGGQHLVVDGLHFRNGYSPNSAVIRYMIGEDSIANNCRVTNTVIEDFSKPNRATNDRWIEFYGKHNQLDHCYIAGKANDGETLRVFFTGNEHVNNYHQIVNNHFGPRPRKGGPRAETIRVGDSKTRLAPGYVNVTDNYFEACNGEVEVISDKTNYNSFNDNIFYKCEGSLVLRHGNYATVDGNIFIGGDDSDFYGGVRIVNTGHWITNNYFYKIRGGQFRSPLAVMNGIPRTPLNRYLQVADVVVAYNTWVDCKSPWQIGVGQNKESSDVLPPSEIRSAPPIRTTIANNLIYNTEVDETPLINHDDMDGILFRNNIISNHGDEYSEYDVLRNASVNMRQVNEWLIAPEDTQNDFLDSVFNGYDFARIERDLFGTSRGKKSRVGAINDLGAAEDFRIDKSKYGPDWYSTEQVAHEPKVVTVSAQDGELLNTIRQVESGNIIELTDGTYTVEASLDVDKDITIRPRGAERVTLVYAGGANTPLFTMRPKGSIRLERLTLQGQAAQLAFAPLQENMSSSYKLLLEECTVENFDYFLKASEGSFADSINVRNTTIRNCTNGIVLAADEKGDYNAEMVTFNKCEFLNVQRNVIHFYRGGYDESTIGGFLTLSNNTFVGCGGQEESGVLVKTPGIVNVRIFGNTFRNNPVDLVARLWGTKNNYHGHNTLIRSGRIVVEDQQKLDILY